MAESVRSCVSVLPSPGVSQGVFFGRIPVVCMLLLQDLCTNTLAITVQIFNIVF